MLNLLKHRVVLFNILKDIYKSSLSNLLGFKGGTMAYFFYGLDRFSVDLDFDILDDKKIDYVKKVLPNILKKYGEIIESYDKYSTLFYLLSYEKKQRQIKIEISKRDVVSNYHLSNFYGIDIYIQNVEDAFATKLLACTTRKKIAYRDFYDVLFYLKKGVNPNEEIIKKITGKNTVDYLNYLKEFIEKNVTNQKVIEAIGELVNEKQKNFLRKDFKNELLSYLNLYLKNI